MKQKIKLCTDSASDIPGDFEEEYGIGMFKFHITIDDFEFDERDIPNEEFYRRIAESKNKPTHAQVTTYEFTERFKQYLDEGYTDVIYVSISSKGSYTYNSSLMARDEFFENNPGIKDAFRIHIIDGGNYTGVYGYAVCQAAKKVAGGAGAEEVVAYIQDWVDYADVYFGCYTLEYVKRSARVSAAAAFVGEVLGLRPVIKIKDGISSTMAKVRGDKNVIPKIIELTEIDMEPKSPYCVLYGCNPEQSEEITKAASEKLGYPPEMTFQLGPCVASNAGPYTIGLIYRSKVKR
jgi:DegV family protein with EDD domain